MHFSRNKSVCIKVVLLKWKLTSRPNWGSWQGAWRYRIATTLEEGIASSSHPEIVEHPSSLQLTMVIPVPLLPGPCLPGNGLPTYSFICRSDRQMATLPASPVSGNNTTWLILVCLPAHQPVFLPIDSNLTCYGIHSEFAILCRLIWRIGQFGDFSQRR